MSDTATDSDHPRREKRPLDFSETRALRIEDGRVRVGMQTLKKSGSLAPPESPDD